MLSGAFVGRVRHGGTTSELLPRIRTVFRDVKHVKPCTSRPASAELYLVTPGYPGASK
jgi:23S rRNA (uridine2552-2'-O)-methyltransferase